MVHSRGASFIKSCDIGFAESLYFDEKGEHKYIVITENNIYGGDEMLEWEMENKQEKGEVEW